MDDFEIIQLFLNRDENAIRSLDNKYRKYLFKIAFNILGNEFDTEEVINDTYMVVWNNIPPNNPGESLRIYLGKITRNLSISRVRRLQSKKRRFENYTECLEEMSEFLPDGEDTESAILNKEMADVISEFLKTINKHDKDIFVCRYFYVMKIREISKLMHIKEGTIKACLSKTGKKLKTYLEERGLGDE